MSFTAVTITAGATGFRNEDGSVAKGIITFLATAEMANGGEIRAPTPVVAALDNAGQPKIGGQGGTAVILPATDDAGTLPSGVTYWVYESIQGASDRRWSLAIPHTSGTLDLSTVAPALAPNAAYAYALDAQIVHLVGTETITGAKTFSLAPAVPDNSFAESKVTNLVADLAAKATDTLVVHLAGIETITGVKTFSAAPVLPVPSATPSISAVADAAAKGSSQQAAMSDHVHGRESFATPGTSAVGDAAAQGSAATLSRSDHLHGREAFGAVVAQTSFGLSSANGTALTLARSDHGHGTPVDTALVHLAGVESITGVKTFTANPVFNAAAIPDAALSANVDLLNAQQTITGLKNFTQPVTGQAFTVTGLTGAQTPSRLIGATASGPPTSGTFSIGDWEPDLTGKAWICNDYLYPAAVKTAGAQDLWLLNDTGATALDHIGALNGTLIGGITTGVTGPNSDGLTAMTFNGTTGYIDCGTSAPLGVLGEPFSIAVIAKQSASSGNRCLISNATIGSNLTFNYAFQFTGTGQMRFLFGNGTVTYNGGVDDGLWHYWVGTYDGNTTGGTASMKLYKDFVLVASAVSPNIQYGSLQLAIGRANATGGRYYNGTLAAVGIFKGVELSPSTIKALFNKASAAFPFSFVGAGTATAIYPVFNIKDPAYGAKGEGRVIADAAITTGTAILTSSAANFTQADADAKREVCIQGAGAAAAPYRGNISGFTNSTTVTLDTNAGTTVTNAFATIGQDDQPAIEAAERAMEAAGGGTLYGPETTGLYLVNTVKNNSNDGSYNFKIAKSNVRWLFDGGAAVLQQGPCGSNGGISKLVVANGSFQSVVEATTKYLFNAGSRGDWTLTLTTASDAANFAAGDVLYIRSTPAGIVSGVYTELNIVTTANAGTGVLGLRWPLGKDYAQVGTYGVWKANASAIQNIAFENVHARTLDRFWTGGGIIGLRWDRCNINGTDQGAGLRSAAGDIIAPGFIRNWRFLDCDLTWDYGGVQFDSGMSDLLVDHSRWTQQTATTNQHQIAFTENCANSRFINNDVWSAGASSAGDAVIAYSEVWGLEIAHNKIWVNVNVFPAGMNAIYDSGTGLKANNVVVEDNDIFGMTLVKSAGTSVKRNRVTYVGSSQAIITQGDGGNDVTDNIVYLKTRGNTGIYLSGTSHQHRALGNRIYGDSTASQRAMYVADDGAGILKGPTILNNYGANCPTGLQVQNTAHEPGMNVAWNDFSQCTTPYNPVSLSSVVIPNALRRSTQTPTETVLVSGVDATAGEEISVTLSAARVVGAPLNPALGQELTFTLIQNGTGGWAVTWNVAFKVSWSDAGNTLNKRSSIVFWYDGTNWNQKSAQTPYI